MYLKLRILFTILSAICVAIAIPAGVWFNFTATIICAALAFMFYLIMLTFKLKHESLNPTQTDEAPTADENKEQETDVDEEKK